VVIELINRSMFSLKSAFFPQLSRHLNQKFNKKLLKTVFEGHFMKIFRDLAEMLKFFGQLLFESF
jgi:hypothetical protein